MNENNGWAYREAEAQSIDESQLLAEIKFITQQIADLQQEMDERKRELSIYQSALDKRFPKAKE